MSATKKKAQQKPVPGMTQGRPGAGQEKKGMYMKALRFLWGIAIVSFIFMGCGSPLQKADKLAMSDPKSAIAIYEQIMKTKPGTAEAQQAHLKMAETYYKQMDDQEKGLEVYGEVVKAYPKTETSGRAYWAIATHYFQTKDYEKARENFAKVAEEVPGTELATDASLAIAKCHEEQRNFEEAARLYLEFSKAYPQHRRAAQAGLDAGKIYENQLDKPDEAIEAYKHVAGKYGISSSGREAREALTRMGVDQSEIPGLSGTGAPQIQADETPRTTSQFGVRTRRRASNVPRPEIGGLQRPSAQESQGTQAPTPSPTPASPSRSVSPDFGVDVMDILPVVSVDSQGTMYDAMYMYGITLLQSEQFRESGALFERAIQLAGNKPWENAAMAYFYLGKSYKGIGREDKAREMFKEAIKRDSKIIDQMIIAGETNYGEGEYQKALENYKTALGLVSYKDAEIYYKMGLVYQKLQDADNELDAFERAVALKPSNTDALQHLAEVLYYRKNNPVRAGLYDSEARGQGGNDYKVQKELGDLCYKYESYSWASAKYGNGIRIINAKITEELKKAIGTGEEAKSIADDPAKITLKLVSESAAGGNKLAQDALQKVSALLDEYRYMVSRKALAQIKNKQYKEAQQQLDDAQANDPNIVLSADFHYALGELAIAQGNKDAGIAELKKTLEIDPQHKEAGDRLKGLP